MIDIDRVNWGFSFLFAQEKAIIKEERHYRMSTCFSLTERCSLLKFLITSAFSKILMA